MEFAQAARAIGLRAIHGSELTVRVGTDRPDVHLTLLVEDATGWANLCRLLTIAYRHTREGPPGAPAGDPFTPLDRAARPRRGPRLPVGLHPPRRRGRADAAPPARRLRARAAADGAAASLPARRSRALAAADRARPPARAGRRGHGQRPRPHPRPRPAAGRARRRPAGDDARLERARAPRQPLPRADHAGGDGRALLRRARGRGRDRARGRAPAASTSARTSATATPAPRTAARRGCSPSTAAWPSRTATRPGTGCAPRRGRGSSRSSRSSTGSACRASSCSTATCSSSRGKSPSRSAAPARRARVLPPGRGRGSSVSSIVCYLTGLSHVDPVANQLLLGRFLNEEITALPDIDLDFPRDVREKLLPRIHDVYGREKTALVAAFPTYRARGAIRELGKALGLPPGEIERVARGSEGFSAHDVGRDVATALGADRVATGRWRWLAALADEVHGLPRHLSQHSGGMIVSTQPLIDCVPLVPAAMAGRQICQWDKDSCADAGFLKIDHLGLGMLSAVERTVDLVAQTRNESLDLSRIPYDDPEVYDRIQDADTVGVFQIESRAQMQSLRRTRPENLDDLTIQVAIVRPGPIQGGAVNPYIDRRQKLRADPDFEIPYDHPSLEPVLARHARHHHLPGPGDRGRDGLRRLLAEQRRGAAPGHEPQALGRGDGGAAPRLRRGRDGHARGGRGAGRAGLRDGRGLLGLRLPQGPRRRLRPARLPVDLAAGPLLLRVPVLAAQRAADGLLPARRAGPRGPAARGRDRPARRQRLRRAVRRHARRRGADRPGLRARRARRRRRGARRRPRARRAVPRPRRPRLAGRGGDARARGAGLVGRLRRARGRRPARGALAPGRRHAGAQGARRHPADAAARHAHRARARAAGRVGRDARRLRHHRRLGPPPPARDPAGRAARRRRDRRRPRRRCRTAPSCGSPARSWPASGRGRPTASSSC